MTQARLERQRDVNACVPKEEVDAEARGQTQMKQLKEVPLVSALNKSAPDVVWLPRMFKRGQQLCQPRANVRQQQSLKNI